MASVISGKCLIANTIADRILDFAEREGSPRASHSRTMLNCTRFYRGDLVGARSISRAGAASVKQLNTGSFPAQP